eukprot:TRINITY_DN9169_c0_g1_i1.p1 TRINITY_DN9169_c0_g1~~TRINITY_DN9169_c0_g1_i1.p1  ORF type:complete len:368 (-),score=47.89 TRINITY_DN9169_c0_g1_i1:185-1288(-)
MLPAHFANRLLVNFTCQQQHSTLINKTHRQNISRTSQRCAHDMKHNDLFMEDIRGILAAAAPPARLLKMLSKARRRAVPPRAGSPRSSLRSLGFGVLVCFGLWACCALFHVAVSPDQQSPRNAGSSLSFAAVVTLADHQVARPGAFGLRGGALSRPQGQHQDKSLVVREAMEFELPLTGVRALVQHVNRWPGRMTERWLGPVNFDRAGLRLDTMDTYAVVASVFLGCLLGLYGSVSDPDYDTPTSMKTLFDVQMALLMVATLCASFTTFIFLINKLFAATAMGLWKDVAFFTYQYHTAVQRKMAFWSLVLSMLAFIVTFALNLYEKIQGRKGKAAAGLTLFVGGIMAVSCKELMDLANALIFQSFPY